MNKSPSGPIYKRNLEDFIQDQSLDNHKMVFLSGPRQCGKTTLAKSLVDSERSYFNWDNSETKKLWTKNPVSWGEGLSQQGIERIILDEFHKNPKWKNQLKGFYDHLGTNLEIIVTGSAKLNTYRKGADSLLGRFIHYHVNPFTHGELLTKKTFQFLDFTHFLNNPEASSKPKENVELQNTLLRFGGFPEVFQKQDSYFHNIWRQQRIEVMVRQDLRDLSNIISINQVEILASLLPERVGSPLSVQSLVEDLEGSYNSVKKWLAALENIYYHFELKPFSNSIVRSLKKEGKIFLYDWTQVEDEGNKYENMIALHLLKLAQFYNDTGQAQLELKYLRNKDKKEVDFILLNKKKPILTIEAKLNELQLSRDFEIFHRSFQVPHFQIINKAGYLKKYSAKSSQPAYVIGFGDFFRSLP